MADKPDSQLHSEEMIGSSNIPNKMVRQGGPSERLILGGKIKRAFTYDLEELHNEFVAMKNDFQIKVGEHNQARNQIRELQKSLDKKVSVKDYNQEHKESNSYLQAFKSRIDGQTNEAQGDASSALTLSLFVTMGVLT